MHIIDNFIGIIFTIIGRMPIIIISVVIAWLTIKFIIFIIKRSLKIAKTPKDVSIWVVRLAMWSLWTIFIIIAAQALGFGSLAVAMSGSAAIIAFFLSVSVGPALSSIFSGMILSGDKDIKVGMRIITNNGKTEGIVRSMDMRKVRIEDDKGVLHVLPNSTVENDEWIVVERPQKKAN